VQTPALRAVGNIVTGDDKQTDVAIRCGCLPALMGLLNHRKKGIRKETCWTISNITAGSKEQIQEVINVGIVPPVIDLLSTAEFDIKKEAAWAISNATNGGHAQQVEYLVHCGCIKPLCDMLSCSDNKMVIVALDAIDNLLKTGEAKQRETGMDANPYCQLVEEADGLSKMEQLQQECNEDIYKKSIGVMTKYWVMEEDAEDADQGFGMTNTAVQQPQGGFNFGA
jgi:hypothetical protein